MSQLESEHESEVQDSSNQSVNTQQIRQRIQLSNFELKEICNDNTKFFNTINDTNNKAINKITSKLSKQALVYLGEAQRVLQFGACCGKVIDRNLIICTLHNEAAAYQRLWALDKCSKYIEAVIYNIESSLKVQQSLFLHINLSQGNNISPKQYELLVSVVKKKIFLVQYYLQFCAIMSQNKMHQSSLNASNKSLKLIQEVMVTCYQFFKANMYKQKQQMEVVGKKLRYLKQLANQQPILQSDYIKLLNKVRKTYKQWKSARQKERLEQSNNQNSNPSFIDNQLRQWIKTYAIGNVMQIQPKTYKQFDTTAINSNSFSLQFSMKQLLNKILLLIVCYFTIGTQMRLLQNQKHSDDAPNTKINKDQENKLFQMYHLKAILFFCTYIHFQSHFISHILNSYSNHYKADLSKQESIHLISPKFDQSNEKPFEQIKIEEKRDTDPPLEIINLEQDLQGQNSIPQKTQQQIDSIKPIIQNNNIPIKKVKKKIKINHKSKLKIPSFQTSNIHLQQQKKPKIIVSNQNQKKKGYNMNSSNKLSPQIVVTTTTTTTSHTVKNQKKLIRESSKDKSGSKEKQHIINGNISNIKKSLQKNGIKSTKPAKSDRNFYSPKYQQSRLSKQYTTQNNKQSISKKKDRHHSKKYKIRSHSKQQGGFNQYQLKKTPHENLINHKIAKKKK